MQGGDLRNNIRISAGRPSDTLKLFAALNLYEATRYNSAAVTALRQLKAVECLLWDMDGVLLDVSQVFMIAILWKYSGVG
jgi:hypothetical protein